MTKHRILVCGGRDYNDRKTMFKALDDYCKGLGLSDNEQEMPFGVMVISGGASGADGLAIDWATVNFCSYHVFIADWQTHGKAAGPIRNKKMLDEGKPDVVIAFPGGRGTANMVKLAKEAGVKVVEVE